MGCIVYGAVWMYGCMGLYGAVWVYGPAGQPGQRVAHVWAVIHRHTPPYISFSYSKLYSNYTAKRPLYGHASDSQDQVIRMAQALPSVADFLASIELSSYAEAFDEHGWDSLRALFDINESDLNQLITDVGMKSGHAARFRRALIASGSAGELPVQPAFAPPEKACFQKHSCISNSETHKSTKALIDSVEHTIHTIWL